MAEFCIKVAILDLEFLDRVGRRNDGRISTGVVAAVDFDVVVNSVQTKIVLPDVDAVNGKIGAFGAAGVRGRLGLAVLWKLPLRAERENPSCG